MSSEVIVAGTKRYSVWQRSSDRAPLSSVVPASKVKISDASVENLAKVLELRKSAKVSGSWQREVGVVPQSAYSEGQYSLKFKNGKTLTVKETFAEIGMRVWDCAPLMSRWFEKGDFVKGRRVLELGSGTGLLGLSCAALGASHVVLTDLPSILKTMEANIAFTGYANTCVAQALNWNDIKSVDALKQKFGPFDLIVASDVLVFANDAQTDGGGGLIQALTHLADPSSTEILMGCNKNRHGFLVGFYANPPTHLFDIEVVGKEECDPEYFSDSVMLYRMRLKPKSSSTDG